MRRLPVLVTLDGPAASGKTTITRRLAAALGVPYLYTGAMYRAVTWLAGIRGVSPRDESGLARLARGLHMTFANGRDGRTIVIVDGRDVTVALQEPEIARITSAHVASFGEVRRALVERQRRFETARGLVAEGRDCGSVVFPHAPYKFYLTASFDERVRRRVGDLVGTGIRTSQAQVRRDMMRRDREDRARPGGALAAQPDSWIVDNTSFTQDETIRTMLRRIAR